MIFFPAMKLMAWEFKKPGNSIAAIALIIVEIKWQFNSVGGQPTTLLKFYI
jgi:hypothetical protein